MTRRIDSPNIRKGRFLYMDDGGRRQYLETLNRRIASGYYTSEGIIGKVVDEIAPVINDVIDSSLQAKA